jgi:two-component system sensor histidine kinase UhpB
MEAPPQPGFSGYFVGVSETGDQRTRAAARGGGLLERAASRYLQTSLYVRVVAINALIFAGATLVLVLTPATVGYPIRLREAVVLVAGLVAVIVANALVLRISFGGLASMVERMRTVDLLQPQERLAPVGGPETRALVAGLNQMLTRLETERRESNRRTLSALEDERRRIALELHDEIGQRLTGMLLQLGSLVTDAPPDLRARIVAVQEDVRETLDEVGMLAWQLRPGILDDLGLVQALEALTESLDEQSPQVRVRCSLPATLPELAPDVELAVYRVVQEALTNAARHSRAGNIRLEVARHGARLTATVSDDGVGMAADEGERSGLRGMRERAFAIDATLAIDTTTSGGTCVRLELPLPAGPA